MLELGIVGCNERGDVMSTVDMEKLKKLLSQDIQQSSVAAALGCTEGFISQCLSEESFRHDVAALKLARVESVNDRDITLDKMEDKIIKKLDKAVDYMMRPQELLAAFKAVNSATRRGAAVVGNSQGMVGQVVTVILPVVHSSAFIRNQNGEIIEADGRSLATLPSNVLKQMAAANLQLGVNNNGNIQTTQREITSLDHLQAYKTAAVG